MRVSLQCFNMAPKNIESYDILRDIYNIVDRLENKMDKRLCSLENRTDKIEDIQARMLGAVSIMALFVGGAVTWVWQKITG